MASADPVVVTKPRDPNPNEILTQTVITRIGNEGAFKLSLPHIQPGLSSPFESGAMRARLGWFTQAAPQIPFEPWMVFSMTDAEDSSAAHQEAVSHYLPTSGEHGWHWHIHWVGHATAMISLKRKMFLSDIQLVVNLPLINATTELLGMGWLASTLSFPPFEQAILRFHGQHTVQVWIRLRPGVPNEQHQDAQSSLGGLGKVSQGEGGLPAPLPVKFHPFEKDSFDVKDKPND